MGVGVGVVMTMISTMIQFLVDDATSCDDDDDDNDDNDDSGGGGGGGSNDDNDGRGDDDADADDYGIVVAMLTIVTQTDSRPCFTTCHCHRPPPSPAMTIC